MATLVLPSNTNLSQTLSFERRNSFRDPSFSSYLSSSEENDFIVKLTESTKKPSPLTMNPQGRVKDTEDEEIGVFGAEKYFKGELKEESTRKVISKRFSTMHLHQNGSSELKSTHSSPNYLVSANMCLESQKKQLGTRSVRSESSVNSQSVLLHRVPRNREHSKERRRYFKNFFASLGCNCNNKAAVEVDEQSIEKGTCSKEMTKLPLTNVDLGQEVKLMQCAEDEIHINLRKEDCFSFPVLNSRPGIQGFKMLNNWESPISREEEIKISSYNDAESNASSDLFELESFSTNEISTCVTPISCYAPSEASIEWSVVTASATDFSTFLFPEGINGKQNNLDRMIKMTKFSKTGGKYRLKRQLGILSGCKNIKAVKIVENEYRTTGEMNGGGNGGQERSGLGPVTKFQPESKLTSGSDSVRGHGGFSNCSLPQSHSQRLLFIQ